MFNELPDPATAQEAPVLLWFGELTELLRSRGVDLEVDIELRDTLFAWAAHYAESYRSAAEKVLLPRLLG